MYIKKFKEIKAFLRRSKEARFKRYLDLYGDNSLSFGKKLLGYFNYNFLWKLKPLVHSRKKLILGKKIMFLLDVQKRIGWKCVVVSVVMYKNFWGKFSGVEEKSIKIRVNFMFLKRRSCIKILLQHLFFCYLAACKDIESISNNDNMYDREKKCLTNLSSFFGSWEIQWNTILCSHLSSGSVHIFIKFTIFALRDA